MKKLFGMLMLSLLLFSCQDEGRRELMEQPEAEKVPDSIQILEGEFIYSEEAAILRGDNFVYGVTLDSMSKALSEKIAPIKSDDFEMVPVTVKAQIKPNHTGIGWEELIDILEIVEIPESAKVSDSIKD